MTLSQVFSMDEAAERLHISRRQLQEIVKRHPHYVPNGQRKLFTEADLAAILAGLREEREPCPSASNRPARANRRTGRSAAPISASAWTKAQALLTKPSREGSSRSESVKSNVVALPPR